jgi:hypothetical protein
MQNYFTLPRGNANNKVASESRDLNHVTVDFAAGQRERVGRARGGDGGVEWGWGGCLVGWGVGVGVGVGATQAGRRRERRRHRC